MRAAAARLCALLLAAIITAGCTVPVVSDLNPEDEDDDGRARSEPEGGDAAVALRVGVLLPGEGRTDLERGLRLALQEGEARVDQPPVELLFPELNATSTLVYPEVAVRAAENLVVDGRVHALLGGEGREADLAVAAVAESMETPFLSPTVRDHILVSGREFVFAVAFSNGDQAGALARFAREEAGAGTAAVVYDLAAPRQRELGQAFARAFGNLGGSARAAGYDPGEDAGEVVAQIEARADVALLATGPESGAAVLAAMREAGNDARVIGPYGWSVAALRDTAGDAAAGTVYPVHFHSARSDAAARAFVEVYRETYGGTPDDAAALGYDAMSLLLEAATGVAEGGRLPEDDAAATRLALRDALRLPGEFQGITGRRLADGEEVRKTVLLVRVVGGRVRPELVGEFSP